MLMVGQHPKDNIHKIAKTLAINASSLQEMGPRSSTTLAIWKRKGLSVNAVTVA